MSSCRLNILALIFRGIKCFDLAQIEDFGTRIKVQLLMRSFKPLTQPKEIWKGKMSKVFIHESAILRKRDFSYVEVNPQAPSTWVSSRIPLDGVLKDFSNTLLRLESTNHCNFACSFCPHPTMERKKGFMDEKTIHQILDEAGKMGFKMLDLRNFGEPIMDKRLAQFATHARSRGFSKIYIHTNGHLLNSKRLDEWGEGGITEVNLSLSPQREFSETRPGINVEKFFKNIEDLVNSKPKYLPILNVDYINTGLSSDEEVTEFTDWLAQLGIEKRMDIALHNWAVGEEQSHYFCHRLWSSITILWNGQVSLCCLDYEGDYKLGYLGAESKETLSSVINSDVYVEIRNNHLKGKFLEKCKSCDMPRNKDHIESR
jgi:organic radical activating enzyme